MTSVCSLCVSHVSAERLYVEMAFSLKELSICLKQETAEDCESFSELWRILHELTDLSTSVDKYKVTYSEGRQRSSCLYLFVTSFPVIKFAMFSFI